tara:strand:+ start:368 stop:592 length:225 start_codon:yes stop_codon:yes gene_type:complete
MQDLHNGTGGQKMNEELDFWEEVDTRIYDIIQLIRLRYNRFNGTPIEKVVVQLHSVLQAGHSVQDALAKGWHVA